MMLSQLSNYCLLQCLQLFTASKLHSFLPYYCCFNLASFFLHLLQDKLVDKLPATALNRPPTQQRAPDPGRFRSIDMQPENAQQDPSYQRMVQDVSTSA
jgi:hypothetical protein